MKNTIFSLFFALWPLSVFSQNETPPDTLDTPLSINDLAPVTVTAYRLEEPETEVPLAITRIGLSRLQRGEAQLTLNDALNTVPGLYAQNEENFAQDLRVSIRGFGARSSFGIRGLKVMQDGFPESTPDGQGQVDNIDPSSLRSVEVIRGQTAGLYGNASGGSLNFTTLDFSGKKRMTTGYNFGSFGFQKFYVNTAGKKGRTNYSFHASHLGRQGYRDNSQTQNYLLNSGFRFRPDSTLSLTVAFNFVYSPEANDPGSLRFSQVEDDPAQSRNNDWGEEVTQGRLGIFLEKKAGEKNVFAVKGYQTLRKFRSIIFIGHNDIDRRFSGINLAWNHDFGFPKIPWKISAGTGIEDQLDERRRFDAVNGTEEGNLEAESTENFTNLYGFASTKLSLLNIIHVHAAIRFDDIRVNYENLHLEALRGNTVKDNRNYQEASRMLGLTFAFDPAATLYFNFSSAFETPTLRESIAVSADSLNRDLGPQRAATREMGLKGWLKNGRLHYDITLFLINTEDEILQFDVQNDIFEFQNIGMTTRRGLEFGIGSRMGKNLYHHLSFTHSNFEFQRDHFTFNDDLIGNRIPGIPLHHFWTELRYQPKLGFFATANARHVGKQFADNENEVEVDAYWLVGLRLGFAHEKNGIRKEFFAGMNNLTDTSYFSNLRINDGNGRYYEPAPGRNFVAGLKFELY